MLFYSYGESQADGHQRCAVVIYLVVKRTKLAVISKWKDWH